MYEGNDPQPISSFYSSLISRFPETKNLVIPVHNRIVYHYTSRSVLMSGILSDQNIETGKAILFAFNSEAKNDLTEGLSLTNALTPLENDNYGEPFRRRKMMARYTARSARRHWFSVSFSYDSDSIPMWKEYGLNGEGVAIGFDVEEIWNQGYEIYECKYFDDSAEQIAEIIERHRINYSYVLSLLCKDKHFSYEHECRIPLCPIYSNDYIKTGRDQFHEVLRKKRRGKEESYVEVWLPVHSIKEIIVGPSVSSSSQTFLSLKTWLRDKGLENVKIIKSTAPLAF